MSRHPADIGIETRHKQDCATHAEGKCTCKPGYRGTVYVPSLKTNKRGPWTSSKADARGWRIDAMAKVQQGVFAGASKISVREVGEQWFVGVLAGTIRKPGGGRYKPSTIRSYKSSFDLHVTQALGGMKLAALRRGHVQVLIDRLTATLDDQTVHNAITPLRSICRYATQRDLIPANPCEHLEIPKATGRRFANPEDGKGRENIASRDEAAWLIEALPSLQDRAIWATAFYAGLRRGELRGLYRSDIEMDAKTIKVQRGWDALDGEIETKTAWSARTIPMTKPLKDILSLYLATHDGREFAFPGYGRWGKDYGPFSADALLKRSRKTWTEADLTGIGLHEARHTFASQMIDAGLSLANVSRHMGHSSIAVTERVYVHLLPDAHETDRALMDEYFAGS